MLIPDFKDTPIIDRDQYDMLVATGEDDAAAMLNELLDLYSGEAEPKLIDLRQAAAANDKHRCNRIAHALAGASANLGCMRLAALCRAYENSVQTQTVDELTQGALRIAAVYAVTIKEMRAEVAKLG